MRTRVPADGSKVVRTLAPLRDNAGGRLDVRVVEFRGVLRLDVRQFLETDNFSGHTRRGVSLTAKEFKALLEQQGAILAALDGGCGEPGEPAK